MLETSRFDCDAIGICRITDSEIVTQVVEGTSFVLELLRQIGAFAVSSITKPLFPPEVAMAIAKVAFILFLAYLMVLAWKGGAKLGKIAGGWFLSSVAYLRAFKFKRERVAMTAAEKERLAAILISNAITDALEKAEYKNRLSRDEVQAWYGKLSETSQALAKELLPKNTKLPKKDTTKLKAQIKSRLLKNGHNVVDINAKLNGKKKLAEKTERPKNKLEAMLLH